MQDVRVYDFEFNLLHIEHDISSCNWSLYDNEIGTFEMHYALHSPLTKVAAENRYLVAVQGEKQAIITGKQFGTEGILYGRTCNWILTRFCVCECFDTNVLKETGEIQNIDAQSVCMYLVRNGMGDIPEFVCEENSEAVFGEVYLESSRASTVFELVQKCMKQEGGGHRVYFDVKSKKWRFFLTQGKLLPVVLSEESRNAYDLTYMTDLQELFVGGYFEVPIMDMGDWEIYNNKPLLVNSDAGNYAKQYKVCLDKATTGQSSVRRFGITFFDGDYITCTTKDGIWRKTGKIEKLIEQVEPRVSGIYGWKTKLDGQNEDEAERSLEMFKENSCVSLKAKNFFFGQDYQLGDSVVQKFAKGSFSTRVTRKITGVHLWYEPNDVGEQPIFEEELS